MGLGDIFGSIFGGGGSNSNPLSNTADSFLGIPLPIASAGIFSAATLASQLFGQNVDQEKIDLAKQQFQQDIANSNWQHQYSEEELASREKLAEAAAGAQIKAAEISAGAQTGIARQHNLLELGETRAAARQKAGESNIAALQGKDQEIMQGRTAQANQAQATGINGQRAFESLIQGIQAGLRH